jgi:hypothetical protein
MEDLPEALLAEIVRRVTKRSDLNSLSLVSKRLFAIEAEQKECIRVGCGLCLKTEELVTVLPVPQFVESRDRLRWMHTFPWGPVGQ